MNNDAKVRAVLRTWAVNPRPAAGFKSAVWQRIAAAEEHATAGLWSVLREWLFVQLPRPAYASALLLVTAVISITAANVRAGHARDQYRLDSARHYLASIDPIAMNANAARSAR
jgi:hypothetical protein